jgi:hypothetical protein
MKTKTKLTLFVQGLTIPGKIGQKPPKVTGHKIKIQLNGQRFMCTAVIIAKLQAVLDSITKWEFQMPPGIVHRLQIGILYYL